MSDFVRNRYKYAKNCPCGKDNKDGKFCAFSGQEPDGQASYGYCQSCGITFFPPKDTDKVKVTDARQQYIDAIYIDKSQSNQMLHDNFFVFLKGIGIDAYEAARKYNLGTSKDGTVFWLVDASGRVCQPKIIPYGINGKRTGQLKVPPQFTGANGYFPCLFGAHLLFDESKVVGVVESEKTAVLCNEFFPELIWVAAGGANGLSPDKAHPLRKRDVVLFYDADQPGRDGAEKTRESLLKKKCRTHVVDLFDERVDGYDLADFIAENYKYPDRIQHTYDIIKNYAAQFEEVNTSEFDRSIYTFDQFKDRMLKNFREGKKQAGETTHIKELDPYFKWRKSSLVTFTGYPNFGKSEALVFLATLKAKYDGWRWLVFAPESMSSLPPEDRDEDYADVMTIEDIGDSIIHTLTGKNTDSSYDNLLTEQEYSNAIDFISDHFVITYPQKGMTTMDKLIEQMQYVIDNSDKQFDGVIVDPVNHLMSEPRKGELFDETLIRELSKMKNFAMMNHVVVNMVVHPKSATPDKNGQVPPANAFMLRGGAAFNNKSDAIISVHRPDWFKDIVLFEMPDGTSKEINGKNSTKVEFVSQKLKNQKKLGAILGNCELRFDRKTNRYTNPGGLSPFDVAYRNMINKKEPLAVGSGPQGVKIDKEGYDGSFDFWSTNN